MTENIFEKMLAHELGVSALERIRAVAALNEERQRVAALEQELAKRESPEKPDVV